jgi:DNA replication protein DnaC
MEISASRTIAPGLKKMVGSSLVTETRECPTHGAYLAMVLRSGWTGCPNCTPNLLREEVAKQEQAAAEAALLRRAGVPPRFANRRLATFQAVNDGAGRALAVAEAYAGDFRTARATGRSLILSGDVGTGKTHLALGIAHQVMAIGYTARYTVFQDAVLAVKETYRKESTATEAKVIETFVSPDLLVLDEVGVQRGSETEKIILFSIVNGRYNEMKPTIVISNLALEPLKEFLTDRVMDRLREGGGRAVAFDWESFRRTA